MAEICNALPTTEWFLSDVVRIECFSELRTEVLGGRVKHVKAHDPDHQEPTTFKTISMDKQPALTLSILH